MRAPRLLAATLASLPVLGPSAARAVPLDTAGMTTCETYGYGTDVDRAGSNLRAAPRADAPIIGRLAPREDIGNNRWTGVTFKIEGSKDGWLLIRDPDPPGGMNLAADHAGDGRAWISAGLVSTTLGTFIFRTAPRRDAPSGPRLEGDSWGPYSLSVLAVHGCSGLYIDVTVRPYGGGTPVRGWSFWPCAAQLTTCDRPNPDTAERLQH